MKVYTLIEISYDYYTYQEFLGNFKSKEDAENKAKELKRVSTVIHRDFESYLSDEDPMQKSYTDHYLIVETEI